MTIEQLESAIAELAAQLAVAKEAALVEGKAARDAIVYEYDYTVEWPHPSKFRVARQITRATADAISAHNAAYPLCKCREPFVGGMTYSVLVGGYVEGHGGNIVVSFGDDRRSFEPEAIRPEDLETLRAGIVPDSIKKD